VTFTAHLTNEELIDQLTLRDDLTDLEHDLLDRLIRAVDALAGFPDLSQPNAMELGFGAHD